MMPVLVRYILGIVDALNSLYDGETVGRGTRETLGRFPYHLIFSGW